jgi:hypothetical protein
VGLRENFEDGGSTFLRNIDKLPNYAAPNSRSQYFIFTAVVASVLTRVPQIELPFSVSKSLTLVELTIDIIGKG